MHKNFAESLFFSITINAALSSTALYLAEYLEKQSIYILYIYIYIYIYIYVYIYIYIYIYMYKNIVTVIKLSCSSNLQILVF